MTPETIGTAAAGLGILIASVWNGWQSVQAKRAANGAKTEATAAKGHASNAEDNSKPVSNGFTAHVRTQLADIAAIATDGRDAALRAEAKADATAEVVARHLEAHATASLQVVQGGR